MKIETVYGKLKAHANCIEKYFKTGMKITILVRHPKILDSQIVVSNDNLDEAAKILIASIGKPEYHGGIIL